MLQLRQGKQDPIKGSWALSYKTNSTKNGGQHNNATYLESNNMLLKFNNSGDNQEDWSLTFHRGRTDISEDKINQNMAKADQRRSKGKRLKFKRDRLSKGSNKAKLKRIKETLIPTDKGWSVFKTRWQRYKEDEADNNKETWISKNKVKHYYRPMVGGLCLKITILRIIQRNKSKPS